MAGQGEWALLSYSTTALQGVYPPILLVTTPAAFGVTFATNKYKNIRAYTVVPSSFSLPLSALFSVRHKPKVDWFKIKKKTVGSCLSIDND